MVNSNNDFSVHETFVKNDASAVAKSTEKFFGGDYD